MNKPKPSKDCETDSREKQHALYVDDFGDIKMWKQVCEMFGVPTDEEILPDQIYFNAKDRKSTIQMFTHDRKIYQRYLGI